MEHSIEEFEQYKVKVMKYIMYKKRTEYEVKNKFNKTIEENLLNDIIEYVKQAGYLSDTNYIERTITEYKALNNLSRKEIKYKLYSKGINNNLIEDYFNDNADDLYEYELKSAKKIIIKKNTDETEIEKYLLKKGYSKSIIKQALNEDEEY